MKTKQNLIQICLLAAAVLCAARSEAQQADYWVPTGLMKYARWGHTATLLPNGNVFAAGGYNGTQGDLSSTDLYCPASGTWTGTPGNGNAMYDRDFHTATLLPNGKVLVAGGFEGFTGGTSVQNAELYYPNGSFCGAMNIDQSRAWHTATLMANGKVLIAGGWNDVQGPVSSVEVYDPNNGYLGAWTTTTSMGTARFQHTATLLPNGKVLVAGGYGSSGPLASAEIYDPATGTWTPTNSMSTARWYHTATLMANGKVLVAGGNNSAYLAEPGIYLYGANPPLASAEVYDPATGNWTPTGALNTARYKNTATLLPDGMVLVAGGEIGTYPFETSLTSAELYNYTTGTWTTTGALNTARQLHTATLLAGGQVLVAGGDAVGNTAELFNPGSGTWTGPAALDMAYQRECHTATLLTNGTVLVAGGYNGGYLSTVENYYPHSGHQWWMAPSMTTAREQHTATMLLNGTVLVAGGYNGSALNSAEVFNVNNLTWTATNSMQTARFAHTGTLLSNGKVLVAGGYNGGYLASAELYDPVSGMWTTTGSMNSARFYHTATLLPNGAVLVAGGRGSSGYLASAELYNPVTGKWTATGSLITGRWVHTATLLPNGQVLVAGGDNGNYLASAELYNPATGTWTATGLLNTARENHTATLLPNGKVLVAGGDSVGKSAELYDPASGAWTATVSLNNARYEHTATLLPNGKVLVAGGQGSGGATSTAELYDVGLNFSGSSAPQIATVTSPLGLGGTLALTGSGFRGISEGSGGNSQSSPADYPVVQLRSLANEQTVFLLCTNWSTNSLFAGMATNFPPGYALVTVFVNGIPSGSAILDITIPMDLTQFCITSIAKYGNDIMVTWQTFGGTTNVLQAGCTIGGGGCDFADLSPAIALMGTGQTVTNYRDAGAAIGIGAWTVTGSMNAARSTHTATLLANGKVLVAGSEGPGGTYLSSAEMYDPSSGAWTVTGSMSAARSEHAAALLPNGKVLAAGGLGTGGVCLSSAELYDPSSGTWTPTGSMATARYELLMVLLPNGKVLAAGGANSSALVAVAELYDPSSGTWTATGSLINARYLHSLTLLPNGKVLAAGGLGYNGVPYSSAELFDPASGTWTATGSMVNARYFHKATLLPNGQLLASGGTLGPGGSSYLASAELYNPSSGTWTATGSMATTRGLHTSTLLPTGKVLVSGGYNGGRLSEAELYDPASGIWTVTGSLSVGRDGEPATLLPNGEVLNAGGFNGNYQSIAERYDSKTERFYRVRMVQP